MVEGARLESVCTGNRTKGSNPFLSASLRWVHSGHIGNNCGRTGRSVVTRRSIRWIGVSSALLLLSIASVGAQYQGWLIPPGGQSERSPLTSEAKTIARGKAIYVANCARCHGPEGKGNGPDSDYASDLTDDLRTELNTEGVLFYKIWNGRIKYGKGPTEDMPAFQDKLAKDQVWALVEYLKVLRSRPKAIR